MLGKYVRIKITDPIGSVRDGTRFVFPLNYGSVYNADELYSFVLGIDHPVRNFDGRVIATLNPKAGGKQILITAPKSTRFIVNDIKKYIDVEKDFPNYKLECLYESSCGAVVYRDIKGEVRYLLIKNKRSAHWGFPKGHIEPGETKKQTAIREVLEETGVHVRIIDGFESISKYKIQNKIEKQVSIFVGTTTDSSTSIQPEEIEDYIWLSYDNAYKTLNYENDKAILKKAKAYLTEHSI